jgi:hypothetical protein
MISGGTPAVAYEIILARGLTFRFDASSNDMRTTTAAPSFNPGTSPKNEE